MSSAYIYICIYIYMSYGQNLVHGEGTSLSRVGPYRFCSGGTLDKPSWGYRFGYRFRVGPYRFCSDGNPTTLSILLWSYLILSDTHIYIYMHCSFTQRARADQILHKIYNFHNCLASHFDFGSLGKSWRTEVWRSAQVFSHVCFLHRSPHGNCWTGLFGWHCVLMQRDGKQIIPCDLYASEVNWKGQLRLKDGLKMWQIVYICIHCMTDCNNTDKTWQSDYISEKRKNKQQT